MKTLGTILAAILGGLGLVAVIILLTTLPVWLLWNWLMPEIFGLPALTFWQALGVNLLANMLTRGQYSGSSKS